jgi:hypothetical protein
MANLQTDWKVGVPRIKYRIIAKFDSFEKIVSSIFYVKTVMNLFPHIRNVFLDIPSFSHLS